MARLNNSGQVGEVGLLTEPDQSQPWSSWPVPHTAQGSLGGLRFEPVDGSLCMVLGGNPLGAPTQAALRDLSTRVGYPVEFIEKLPLPLQAEVINARLDEAEDLRFTFTHRAANVTENGLIMPDPTGRRQVTNVSPGWRGVLAEADVCQTIYGLLMQVYGSHGPVTVDHAVRGDGDMKLRIMVPYDLPVREGGRSVGDVLQMGLHAWYVPGMDLGVGLYVRRLICLNGMTACKNVFDWKSKAVGRPEDQPNWLTIGVANAVTAFDDLVEKARRMSATNIDGNPEDALMERARALRLPSRFDDRLLDSFRAEPGADEWAMLNAFTRLATHGGIPPTNADKLMADAGDWTAGFDMVTARLPRPVAMNVGARIMED